MAKSALRLGADDPPGLSRCWLDHLMLNMTTGMDPDGLKLRAAQGLEAADYVVGGYWVWGKIST